MSLSKFAIIVDGVCLSPEKFRVNFILPICGEKRSHKVVNNVCYQLFCLSASKEVRDSLTSNCENDIFCIEYIDYGICIHLQCCYFDKVCIATVVKCEGVGSQPP